MDQLLHEGMVHFEAGTGFHIIPYYGHIREGIKKEDDSDYDMEEFLIQNNNIIKEIFEIYYDEKDNNDIKVDNNNI